MSLKDSRNLIKGRIAEVVFEEMIRAEGRFTVIPFGYEHTLPTLAQYRHLAMVQEVMENISDAPDFVLISEDKTKVYLVEVKYQSVFNFEYIKKYAHKLHKRWSPAWIFVATPKGFYNSMCHSIEAGKHMSRLTEKWVNAGRQKEFLELLNEFQSRPQVVT